MAFFYFYSSGQSCSISMAFAALRMNVDEFNPKINLDNGKLPCSVIDIEIYHLLNGPW